MVFAGEPRAEDPYCQSFLMEKNKTAGSKFIAPGVTKSFLLSQFP